MGRGILDLNASATLPRTRSSGSIPSPKVLVEAGSTETGLLDSVTHRYEDETPDWRATLQANYVGRPDNRSGSVCYRYGGSPRPSRALRLCRDIRGKSLFDAELGYRFSFMKLSSGSETVRYLSDQPSPWWTSAMERRPRTSTTISAPFPGRPPRHLGTMGALFTRGRRFSSRGSLTPGKCPQRTISRHRRWPQWSGHRRLPGPCRRQSLVLERRELLGGACVTRGAVAGYKVSHGGIRQHLLRPADHRDGSQAAWLHDVAQESVLLHALPGRPVVCWAPTRP